MEKAKRVGIDFRLILILFGVFNFMPNVTLKANSDFDLNIAPPSLGYQPNSLEVAENNSSIFYFGSKNADTYQWQVRSGGSWSELSISTPYSGTDTKKAIEYIDATNKIINPANVVYESGKAINLAPGFEVENGSVFLGKADLEVCP